MPEGRAQLIANGQIVAETGAGPFEARFRTVPGENRLELRLVDGRGPGRVSFELRGAWDPATLRLAGGGSAATGAGAGMVAYLRGRSGESLSLLFRAPGTGARSPSRR